jgi:SAM-dependent methyltransferase
MDIQPEDLAAHLRKPDGEVGIKIGELMNKGNENFYTQLIKNVSWKDGMRILEIGIGTGLHIPKILKLAKGIQFVGVDYSETMVESSKANNPNQTFYHQDLLKLDLQEEKFDLIFTINTVYFLNDLEKAFTNLKGLLKKDGQIHIGKRPKEDLKILNDITQFGFITYSNDEVIKSVINVKLDVKQVVSNLDPIKEGGWKHQLHSDFIIAEHGN